MVESKVVLITGASSGFGKATAELLAADGCTVFGTSRKGAAGKKPEGIEMLKLDVCSDASVRDGVRAVLDRAKRIDVLVNNAGYQLVGAIEETSAEEAKEQFETNFFGVARMVNAVLPAMREKGKGFIINIGSLAGLMCSPFAGFYTATKFALEGYTETLRQEVRAYGIYVSIVEPGFFRTPITDAMRMAGRSIETYARARSAAVEVTRQSQQAGGDPRVVAKCIRAIVRSRSPRLRYRVGVDSRWLPRLRAVMPAAVFEWGTRVKFGLNPED